MLLDKYLPDYLQRRRDEFLADVSEDLKRLEDRIDSSNIGNDQFISVFLKVTQRAVIEASIEKLDCFRSIIMNTALDPESSFDERSLFISLIDDMTEDQIRILKAIYRANGIPKEEHKTLLNYAVSLYPGIDPDYLVACTTKLLRYNFVSGAVKTPGEKAGLQTPSPTTHHLTGLGMRFVEFISDPLTLRSTGPAQKAAQAG